MARRCAFQDLEEEEVFFDSREDISSASDSCPASPAVRDSLPDGNFVDGPSSDPGYHIWTRNPDNVQERRDRFMIWMGLDLFRSPFRDSADHGEELEADGEAMPEIDRIISDGGAVLRSSGSSSASSWPSEGPSTANDGASEGAFKSKIKNMDDCRAFAVDELGKDGSLRCPLEAGSNHMVTLDVFHRSFGLSSFVQQLMRRENNASSNFNKTTKRRRIGWLQRLGAVSCIVDRHMEENDSCISGSEQRGCARIQRVKVHPYKKQSKELSAIYKSQDIIAYDGAILTMKFSPDGQYLATGGEDGVMRVWRVM